MGKKYVYFFANGKAEGKKEMKDFLGGKGANLHEMTNLGIPVPPGFTISAEVCDYFYKHGRKYPEGLKEEVENAMKKLEEVTGKKFGSVDNPLLVSVRSGAAVSMPGMMDTILNLGLNDETVKGLAKLTGNERFAYDSYRRFIQMFGDVVLGIEHKKFEEILTAKKSEKGYTQDTDLTAEDWKDVVEKYKELYKKEGKEFPQNPINQLWKAIDAVFGSWNNERAIKYREINNIRGLLGTAVNIVTMVFGNMGEDSGTGVAFSRNPSTGENELYAEYLPNAQGEDVVAGIRTPLKIDELKKRHPEIYDELLRIKDILERHFRDMQDMEFTVEKGKLYFLQTRNGKRTGRAAVKIAVDMTKEGIMDKELAIMKVEPQHLDQLLHPMIDPKVEYTPIAKGLPASPGAAVGRVVFTADEAEEWASRGEKVILVRPETSPEDIGGMNASEGILTATGGLTSHAAVVARGMGKPCVVGCKELIIDEEAKKFRIEGTDIEIKEGDYITINGTKGEVIKDKLPLVEPKLTGEFEEFMSWVDEIRDMGVRANAETPHDVQVARDFGAEGIGLARTEHMFFAPERIKAVREMILADTEEDRRKALSKIEPYQKEDFLKIFEIMEGYPVVVRLLDPPLHEFLPKTEKELKELAKEMNVSFEKLQERNEYLKEFNPMLGHRGCRLGITYPEIYEMQVRAIFEAACELKKKGKDIIPEVMIPLVGIDKEFIFLRERLEKVAKEVIQKHGVELHYEFGTMIEVPRAALTSDEIAKHAEFFSFGTNDLTQMTYAFSRDDAGKFIGEYKEKGILDVDPFKTIDEKGVGKLIKMAVELGRSARKDLTVGICGEQGGDPESIEFCYRAGLNYVSASPYRVPIARLCSAQATIKYGKRN